MGAGSEIGRNPWLDRRVIAYAHQGGAWESPSSTIFAIRQALAAGATGIELDVHATSDGHLVVCHDADVDRTTDGTGAIAELTLGQLRDLDPAYWFIPGADVTPDRPVSDYPWPRPRPRRPGVPYRHTFRGAHCVPGVVLNLDIKATAPKVDPYEESLARLLDEFGRSDDVIVASFHDAALEAFARVAPNVPMSAGMQATGGSRAPCKQARSHRSTDAWRCKCR